MAPASLANVLLVDDRETDVYLTRTFLSEPIGMRCNFLVAHDGASGLSLIREVLSAGGSIDLILLDIKMPVMDGFEMLERLRADATMSIIPVVMCTGSTYDHDRQRARALGAAGYIEKPARMEPLRQIIEKASGIKLVPIENQTTALVRAQAC